MIGNALRYIRICNDLTVKEVGQMVDLASTYVCDLEGDRRRPSLQMLEKFSKCYDIEISRILYFAELDDKGKDRKVILKEILEYYIEKENEQNNDLRKKQKIGYI